MPFPARPLALLSAGLLAVSLAAGVTPAGADPGDDGGLDAVVDAAVAANATDDAADGQEALELAEEVLTEGEPVTPEQVLPDETDPAEGAEEVDPGSPVDASMALRDLFLARPALAGDDATRAASLLARPTDGNDPFGNSYSVPTRRQCGPHVCVHYAVSGDDAPPSQAWVGTNVRVMEEVWNHHVTKLGYRRPRSDGGRGGDARFDVYLKEIGSQGLYGYCAPERRVAGQPRQAASYCVLDDDFARSQFGREPVKTLRVTAAHEFFHAVQYAYDIEEDLWLLESTATWMEEVFADAVDDNRAYLPYGQVKRSGTSLDFFNPNGFNHYGNWPIWNYLARRHGELIVRRIFGQTGTGPGAGNVDSITGVRRVLNNVGSFTGDVTDYFAANAYPARSYAEGAAWPEPGMAAERRLSAAEPIFARTLNVNHLASRHVRVTPGSLGANDWLNISVNAPPSGGRFTAAVTVLYDGGRVVRRTIRLNPAGDGRIRTPFTSAVSSATVTLANVSTRYQCNQGTTYACRGESLDDGQPYAVRLTSYDG